MSEAPMIRFFILLFISFNSVAVNIEIIADKAIIDKTTGVTRYIGNAVLTQDGMELKADDIKITQDGDKHYQVYASSNNNLAYFNKKSAHLTSSAKSIIYLSKDGFIKLKGDAKLNKNGNNFTGEVIDYDNANDKVLISGDTGKRVKLKIKL